MSCMWSMFIRTKIWSKYILYIFIIHYMSRTSMATEVIFMQTYNRSSQIISIQLVGSSSSMISGSDKRALVMSTFWNSHPERLWIFLSKNFWVQNNLSVSCSFLWDIFSLKIEKNSQTVRGKLSSRYIFWGIYEIWEVFLCIFPEWYFCIQAIALRRLDFHTNQS